MAADPSQYPARWEAEVVLSDGGTVFVRPIRPDDAARFVEFHERQSPESIYYRYFSPRPRLTERDVERATNVDYVQRMAFVALVGDSIIGVARYDHAPPAADGSARAEVAFLVDDRHHGRGLGTLLLEYLAVAATEAGIGQLVAEVLPDNRAMISVFRRAGFDVSTSFVDGVVEVVLGITPTAEGRQRIDERARRAEIASVSRLMTPATVAVVGAGRAPWSVGHQILRRILDGSFNGAVYPVNPNAAHVAGVRAYPTVSAIPDEVDLAVVAVPAAMVDTVVADCALKRVEAVMIVSDGFSAVDAESSARLRALTSTVRRNGMRLVGPASAGFVNHAAEVRLAATFAPELPPPGRVALSTQSGSMGGAILAYAKEIGLGLSAFVNLGDKADLSANDLVQFWETDPATGVIALYIESIGNARKFFTIARRAGRVKPLVMMRTAGLDRGPLTWPSPETFSALLEQAGVVEVGSLAELFDAARLLAAQPLPAGRRVAVLANGPGTAVLGAETMRRCGLEVKAYVVGRDPGQFAAAVASAVFDAAPVLPAVFDPLPVPAAVSGTGAGVVEEHAPPDAVVVVFAQTIEGRTDAVQHAVDAAVAARRSTATSARPVLACFLGEPPRAQAMTDGDVPRFRFPEDAARSLAHAVRHAEWLRRPGGEVARSEELDAASVRDVLQRVLRDAPPGEVRTLDLDDAVAVLRAAGLAPVAQRTAPDVDAAVVAAATIGFPVALKSLRRGRLARTTSAGLALAVEDEAGLREAHRTMAAGMGRSPDPLLVQAMADPGIEVQVVGHQDDRVGPVVGVGRGGALGSDPHELAVRGVPLTDVDIDELLRRSPIEALLTRLDGDGGTAGLHTVLVALSALMEACPELVEVRLDPLLVSATGCAVTDLRVQVMQPLAVVAPPVRALR